ncbi:MAG TPA: hypothetical protein PK957_03435 [Candidatus Dojkabacteria bacterium]|nr:hypothetical protein [Candidatus Dojkabacteria bacterium]HQF36841.1 hypothetical protein [Candidatus Dojkabacteria bacterium]
MALLVVVLMLPVLVLMAVNIVYISVDGLYVLKDMNYSRKIKMAELSCFEEAMYRLKNDMIVGNNFVFNYSDTIACSVVLTPEPETTNIDISLELMADEYSQTNNYKITYEDRTITLIK